MKFFYKLLYFQLFLTCCLFAPNLLLSQECFSEPSVLIDSESSLTLCQQYGDYGGLSFFYNNASTSQLSTSQLDNAHIVVSGTFTVNTANFSFNNCTIKFSAGAQIVVEYGNRLNIDQSRLFACNEMWKGIDINFYSEIYLTNSRIEDAQYAVRATYAQTIVATRNTFNRNYIGLDLNYLIWNFFPSQNARYDIIGNQFQCTAFLNAAYPNQLPVPGKISFAGIKSNISFLNIGNSSASRNTFERQQIGILSDQSRLTIRNATFDDMVEISGSDYETGIGISCLNRSSVSQHGIGTLNTSFSQCNNSCIKARDSRIFVRNNKMIVNGKHGVKTDNQNTLAATITNNNFEIPSSNMSILAGVSVNKSKGANDVISNNVMEIDNPHAIGIHLFGGFGSSTFTNIHKNQLFVSETRIGLDIHSSGRNIDVWGNLISGSSTYQGIHSGNCYGNNTRYVENIISLNNSSYGIRIDASPGIFVCGNIMDQSDRGILFDGSNGNCVFSRNEFNEHNFGFQLAGTNTFIQKQANQGNKWLGAYDNLAASNGGNPQLSEFIVNDNNASGGDPSFYPNSNGIPSVNPISNWFFKEPYPLRPYCRESELNLTDSEQAIIAGSIGITENESLLWNLESHVYQKLQQHPSLLINNESANAFVDQKNSETIGQLYSINQLVEQAFDLDNELTTHLEEDEELMTTFMEYMDQIQDNPTAVSSLEMATLIASMQNNEQSIEEALVNFNTQKNNLLQQALEANNNLVSEKIYIQNEKMVNNIWIQLLLNEQSTLSIENYAAINAIAFQCPETGGSAVYRARNLLPACEQHNLAFEDACNLSQPAERKEQGMNTAFDLTLAPNPSSQYAILSGFSQSEIYSVILYNASGKSVFAGKVELGESSTILQTAHLPNGVYFVHIHSSKAEKESQYKKLIVNN